MEGEKGECSAILLMMRARAGQRVHTSTNCYVKFASEPQEVSYNRKSHVESVFLEGTTVNDAGGL